jgi:hypothetical protein
MATYLNRPFGEATYTSGTYSSVARIAVTAAPPVRGGNGCWLRKARVFMLKIAKGFYIYILVLNQLNIWKI